MAELLESNLTNFNRSPNTASRTLKSTGQANTGIMHPTGLGSETIWCPMAPNRLTAACGRLSQSRLRSGRCSLDDNRGLLEPIEASRLQIS